MASNENKKPEIQCSYYHSDPRCSKLCSRKSRFSGDDLVRLEECNTDILQHLDIINMRKLHGHIYTEKDLILNRGPRLPSANEVTVCPYHRYNYGVGFQIQRTEYGCAHPNHVGRRKCDRFINKDTSENIFVTYQCHVPIGKRICPVCRKDSAIRGPSKLPTLLEPESELESSVLDSTMQSTYAPDSHYDVNLDMTSRDVTVSIKEVSNETFSSLASALNSATDSSTKHTMKECEISGNPPFHAWGFQ